MTTTIGNPLTWGVDAARAAGSHAGSIVGTLGGVEQPMPRVRTLHMSDLRFALRHGYDDFRACRTDVMFLCLLYPAIGAGLAWVALNHEFLPLVFPILSGFALVGPVAAVGLYAMSRAREKGGEASWSDAFAVVRAPNFGAIFALGLMLLAVFVVWVLTASGIHAVTMGADTPTTLGAFLSQVLTTDAGWRMILLGMSTGLLFAGLVLTTAVVSFPLLLDRDIGLPRAVITSMRVTARNPRVIATWGGIVAISLALGSIPLFLGLIVVLPILGHATWHLYRRAVVAERPAP